MTGVTDGRPYAIILSPAETHRSMTMKNTTALLITLATLPLASAQAAGQPFGQASEGRLVASGERAQAAAAPTVAQVRGFWKGA